MKRFLAILALAAALPASAQTVTFVHKTPVGQVLSIEEASLMEADLDVQMPDLLGGRTKGKWKHLEQKNRVYTQKVVEAPPDGNRTLELYFDTATKETLKNPGKDRVKQNASIHHRRIWATLMANAAIRIEPTPPDSLAAGGSLAPPAAPGAAPALPIADDDKGDILFAERLYSAFPKGEIKPGQVWALDPETAGRALFGYAYNPTQHTVEGKCQFKGTASVEGKKCARILMQLKGGGQLGDLTQGFQLEMAPEGILSYNLDDGFIQAYDLAGPLKLSAGQATTQITAAGPARITLRYKAKLKEKGDEKGTAKGEEKKEGAADPK